MNIKPVSDLRNYPNVLEDVSQGNPVHLTKNGRGSYVIMDVAEFEEYTKERAALQLLLELNKAENTETLSLEDAIKHLKDKKQ